MLHWKVWTLSLSGHSAKMSLQTYVDFLFGNTMLLRLSNRLLIELPDLFLMCLLQEGIKGNGWCIVMCWNNSYVVLASHSSEAIQPSQGEQALPGLANEAEKQGLLA